MRKAIVIVALCVAVPSIAPAKESAPEPARNPVIVVGLDGLEWNVVLPMLRAGRLPVLEGLMQRGVFGELATAEKTVSPAIWASVVTGVKPARHGIEGFVCGKATAEGKRQLCTASNRQVKALWDITTERGLVAHVIGWWQTFPVDPISGVMIAQTNALPPGWNSPQPATKKGTFYAGLDGQVHPPERTEATFAIVRDVEEGLNANVARIFGDAVAFPDPIARELWRACTWAFRADTIYGRIVLELLQEKGPPADLTLVYFGGTDVVGHRFWRYWEPEAFADQPTPQAVAALGDVILDYYEEMDRVLGKILAAAPSAANVFVLSDHGMHAVRSKARYKAHRHARELRSGGHPDAPTGVFVAAGPDIRRASRDVHPEKLARGELADIGSYLDITPTILSLLDLPIGRDMDGRVLQNVLAKEPTLDWVDSHTPKDWHAKRAANAQREDPAVEAERMEQLRSLGYVD